MTRMIARLAVVTLLCFPANSFAQFPFASAYSTGGFGFQYNGGRLHLGGYGYYRSSGLYWPGAMIVVPPVVNVIERRIVVQPLQPQYDLSGIDLDVETPDKLYPPGTAPKRPPGPERLRAPQPVQPIKPFPPPPAKLPPPPAVKPLPKLPPVDELWQPRPGAADESRRLTELGLRAFRAAEYGTALFRFRQAREVDPTSARPLFLLAQAQFAAAEFDAAVRTVHEGLKLNADWPRRDFQPRLELYGDHTEDWRAQLRRLEDALKRKPEDANLLFLRGYVAWFDGQRDQAAAWFMKARARGADACDVELFLKHAPRPALAAS